MKVRGKIKKKKKKNIKNEATLYNKIVNTEPPWHMHNPSKDKVEEAAHDYESTGTMIAKSLRQQKLIFQEKTGLMEFDKHVWQKHTISMHTDTCGCNTHMVQTSKTDHFFKWAPFWSPLTDLIDFGVAGKLLTSDTRRCCPFVDSLSRI